MAADDHGPKGEPIYSASGASDDGADLTEVAAFAAEVGNRKVGTSDERGQALANGEVWEKLRWGDTTDGIEYELAAGAWVPVSGVTNLFNGPPQATAFAERGNTMTAATCSVTLTLPAAVTITGTATAQSDTSMTNWAANLMLFVNNVQVGGYTRIRNQAKAELPMFVSRPVRALLAKGANTIQFRASVDSGSDAPGRLYLVNPQIEVFRG